MSPQALRFGVWRPLGAARAHAEWRAEWSLRRRHAMSSRQMLGIFVALAAISLFTVFLATQAGASTALSGLPVHAAALMAVAQLASMAWALHFFTRHAADRDVIAMRPSLLRVEQHRGGQVRRTEFNPRWVRVEPEQHDGSLVRLSGEGRSVVVGEYVPRGCRPHLAEEFRWALRHLDD